MNNNSRFEQAWTSAEAKRLTDRLMEGFPEWLERRRRNHRIALSALALLLVVGITVPLLTGHSAEAYDHLYSNTNLHPDQYWADVANEMLTLTLA